MEPRARPLTWRSSSRGAKAIRQLIADARGDSPSAYARLVGQPSQRHQARHARVSQVAGVLFDRDFDSSDRGGHVDGGLQRNRSAPVPPSALSEGRTTSFGGLLWAYRYQRIQCRQQLSGVAAPPDSLSDADFDAPGLHLRFGGWRDSAASSLLRRGSQLSTDVRDHAGPRARFCPKTTSPARRR